MPRAPEPRRRACPDPAAARPVDSEPGESGRSREAPGSDGERLSDPGLRHARCLLQALDLDPDLATAPPAAPRSPALDWARSGAMALTGSPDGPPGFAAGPLASFARGAGLALAALAPDRGFEALDAAALLGERAVLFGLSRRGGISCGGSARLLPTRTGFIALQLPRTDDWELLEAWLETPLPQLAATRDWAPIAAILAERFGEDLVDRGREIGLAVAGAVLPLDPAPPLFRIEHATRGTAPAIEGEPASRPPRVLDLSSLWAGPLAGSLLAQAGYEVVKVEHPGRPDGARQGEPRFFDLLNAGKHPCAVDFSQGEGRALFLDLLEGADIVLESARPRALAQLGIDAAAWVGRRPGRLWVSITGYGRAHEWIAFGDDAAVAAGLAFGPEARSAHAVSGDRSARTTARFSKPIAAPRFCADAIADPLTGLTAAVAILGLRARGRGGLLSLALRDVAAHAAAESPLDASVAAPLALPIALRAGAWAVLDGVDWQPIAAPRARTPRAGAPALCAPDPGLRARWARPC